MLHHGCGVLLNERLGSLEVGTKSTIAEGRGNFAQTSDRLKRSLSKTTHPCFYLTFCLCKYLHFIEVCEFLARNKDFTCPRGRQRHSLVASCISGKL